MKICLEKALGRCEKKCDIDYEDHFPNNRDCPNYSRDLNVIVFECKSRLGYFIYKVRNSYTKLKNLVKNAMD